MSELFVPMFMGTNGLSYSKTSIPNSFHPIECAKMYKPQILDSYEHSPFNGLLSIKEYAQQLNVPAKEKFKPIEIVIETNTMFSKFKISDPTDSENWYNRLCYQVSKYCQFKCKVEIVKDLTPISNYSLSEIKNWPVFTCSVQLKEFEPLLENPDTEFQRKLQKKIDFKKKYLGTTERVFSKRLLDNFYESTKKHTTKKQVSYALNKPFVLQQVTKTINDPDVFEKSQANAFRNFCAEFGIKNQGEFIQYMTDKFIGCACKSSWKKKRPQYQKKNNHSTSANFLTTNSNIGSESYHRDNKKAFESDLIGCCLFDYVRDKCKTIFKVPVNKCTEGLHPPILLGKLEHCTPLKCSGNCVKTCGIKCRRHHKYKCSSDSESSSSESQSDSDNSCSDEVWFSSSSSSSDCDKNNCTSSDDEECHHSHHLFNSGHPVLRYFPNIALKSKDLLSSDDDDDSSSSSEHNCNSSSTSSDSDSEICDDFKHDPIHTDDFFHHHHYHSKKSTYIGADENDDFPNTEATNSNIKPILDFSSKHDKDLKKNTFSCGNRDDTEDISTFYTDNNMKKNYNEKQNHSNSTVRTTNKDGSETILLLLDDSDNNETDANNHLYEENNKTDNHVYKVLGKQDTISSPYENYGNNSTIAASYFHDIFDKSHASKYLLKKHNNSKKYSRKAVVFCPTNDVFTESHKLNLLKLKNKGLNYVSAYYCPRIKNNRNNQQNSFISLKKRYYELNTKKKSIIFSSPYHLEKYPNITFYTISQLHSGVPLYE